MTESLIFSGGLAENSDTIFYNIVGNFVPPEWRNLTNNCGKQLSKTSRQLLSLIVSCLQIYQKDKLSEELQEGYHFFEKELGSVDKIFNVTILKLQQNLERLKRWLGLYQT
ncbi:chromosome replication initiator DnaA [Rickettsia endosymbiont of Culicoides newsteadi]|nr:chromosome replication initiator DnaA [Rickettsia endosymbiont of Culicoides newsteadi]